MLPNFCSSAEQKLAFLNPFLQITGFEDVQNDALQLKGLELFLASQLESRKTAYHTALTPPMIQPKQAEVAKELGDYAFPVNIPAISPTLNNFLPMAFKLTLGAKSLLLSSSSLLGLLGPTENFQLLPIERFLFSNLPVLLSQFFLELGGLATGQTVKITLRQGDLISPEKIFAQLGFSMVSKDNAEPAGKRFSKVAWMEIDDFCNFKPTCAEEPIAQTTTQSCLVDRTLAAQIDWVWINLSPNTFLPEGSINKSKADFVIEGLKNFTTQLVAQAQDKQLTPPKFLLGFELGNNIVGKNSPKNFAYDLFGNPYPDIPEPLDFDFWKKELLKPLKSFLDLWKKTEQSKAMPVQGVVADIEFYNRKWTSSFLPTMGFGKKSRELFAMQDADKRAGKMPIEQFVKKLATDRKCSKYFSFLQKSSEQLGLKIRSQVEKLLPGKNFAVYLPNLTFDWFHTGFFRGLSQKTPIHIFSFNTHYDLTVGLMEKKGIKASHSTPFMLSKLNDYEGLGLIQRLYDKNLVSSSPDQSGGIWLNRFSRIAQPFKPNEWYFLEQSKAGNRTRDEFCRTLRDLRSEIN
jgi:hypothetical protein